MINDQTVRALFEEYPHGIPARTIKIPSSDAAAPNSVVFSGPSASRLAIVFFESESQPGMGRDLLVRAITDGLRRPLSDLLLVQCTCHDAARTEEANAAGPGPETSISLADCSPRVILIAGAGQGVVRDYGTAEVICTESLASVLLDREVKKRFWVALQRAWELSQR